MSFEKAAEAMAKNLGPDPVLVFVKDPQARTVAIATGSPEALDELCALGLVIVEQAPEMRKAS
jgi:hypothetical protein